MYLLRDSNLLLFLTQISLLSKQKFTFYFAYKNTQNKSEILIAVLTFIVQVYTTLQNGDAEIKTEISCLPIYIFVEFIQIFL